MEDSGTNDFFIASSCCKSAGVGGGNSGSGGGGRGCFVGRSCGIDGMVIDGILWGVVEVYAAVIEKERICNYLFIYCKVELVPLWLAENARDRKPFLVKDSAL